MDRSDVVVVTGAAGNLGAAVSRRLAAAGRRLVLVDRTPEKLARLIESLPPGCEATPVAGVNLADPLEAEAVVRQALARYGSIGALANTVGGFALGKVAGDALAVFDRMMEANARIALVTTAVVLPAMVERGYGRIVHIAAQPALRAGSGQAAYAASKAAVLRITEAVAVEHRADGIAANCILPGTIDTPQNREAMPDASRETWVTPEAIADLVAFLVSPEGGVVTGGAIPATGPA